jgi:hypothetical protein
VGLMLTQKVEVGVVCGPNVNSEGRGGSCVWA